mmetsp:Transcript_29158/g.34221  ORF Transcript_29158/g.34221 Transcript_29158/m.34221 type:complete len:88 (-) Transcript_29158:1201-1464(-)
MIRSVVVGLVLAPAWPWGHPSGVFLREHRASVHLSLAFAENGGRQSRVAVDHVHLEGERRVVLGCCLAAWLLPLHHNRCLLHVNDID